MQQQSFKYVLYFTIFSGQKQHLKTWYHLSNFLYFTELTDDGNFNIASYVHCESYLLHPSLGHKIALESVLSWCQGCIILCSIGASFVCHNRTCHYFFACCRMVLESALGWYQGRISLYDKQSWETTVEQRILQGLSYTPRKTANPKTEFIDVDLVRGE